MQVRRVYKTIVKFIRTVVKVEVLAPLVTKVTIPTVGELKTNGGPTHQGRSFLLRELDNRSNPVIPPEPGTTADSPVPFLRTLLFAIPLDRPFHC